MFNELITLGIETSCDDTGVSIFNNKLGIIFEYTFTQKIHRKFGGTVPELASQDHLKKIFNIILFVLKKSKIKKSSLNLISYTKGPGLKGSLFIGSTVAKSLSLFLKIPAISINHLEGHILINTIFNSFECPCLILLVSGANTMLLEMLNYNKLFIINETLDDSIGEVFDKIARFFKLETLSGKAIEKNIKYRFNFKKIELIRHLRKSNNMLLSFSGLKSEVLRFNKSAELSNLMYNFQNSAINVLYNKTKIYIKKNKKIKSLLIAGGVSANKEFRLAFKNLSEEYNFNFYILPKKYCTDNGSMIAVSGFIKSYESVYDRTLSIDVYPDLKIK